jgi:hypothetical protein
MGQKLPPRDLKLYEAVDEILYRNWDPIGVAGVPEARDEYRAYLPQVFAMVQNGNGVAAIAGYLSFIRVERMGLDEDDQLDLNVTSMLLAQRAAIYEGEV